MTTPADLFVLTLLATAGLYFGLLVYLNGFLGTKQSNTPILWNSEPILWFIILMFMVWVVFRFIGPDATADGPGVWYLTGTGNLLIVYIYLIYKLARHTVPQKVFWGIVALMALSVVYTVAMIVAAAVSDVNTPIRYPDRLGMLLLTMTEILSLILLWCFVVAFWNSFLRNRLSKPGTFERLTAQAVVIAGPGSPEMNIAPGASVTLDFGTRHIEDHGYKADLRVNRSNTNQELTVEVSNDKQRWAACFLDEKIPTDYDVPYIGNPWRYVRISNPGTEAVQVGEVYDLD